mgnify:CR=1 FL=1
MTLHAYTALLSHLEFYISTRSAHNSHIAETISGDIERKHWLLTLRLQTLQWFSAAVEGSQERYNSKRQQMSHVA